MCAASRRPSKTTGAGRRGSLRAVVRAILLHQERAQPGRRPCALRPGSLREPILRLTAWARAFGATSPS
jgi:uncharacterized protein (DUF1800 family)